MQLGVIENFPSSAVRGGGKVTFEITPSESHELSFALQVIDKYCQLACEKLKINGYDDWAMDSYKVSENQVIVAVETGSCG